MISALVKYLTVDYPKHYAITRHISSLRIENNNGGVFEIADKRTAIIQPQGKGVARIYNNTGMTVKIVDIEKYIAYLAGTIAGEGKCCDFVIAPEAGNSILMLVELTAAESKFIKPYVKPTTGQHKSGKRATAIEQLTDTINRLNETTTFVDDFKKRVALFAFRLTDRQRLSSTQRRNTKAWSRSTRKFSGNTTNSKALPNGFVLEQRQYPQVFEMT